VRPGSARIPVDATRRAGGFVPGLGPQEKAAISPLQGMVSAATLPLRWYGALREEHGRPGAFTTLEPTLPDHVQEFISNYVDSVELIDVLLLLKRQREREWTPDEVSQRIYTTARSAANRLEALRTCGIVSAADGAERTTYRYAPSTAEIERAINDLEQAYATRPTTVINLIFSKPSANIRTFADAFRLREK
jgi:hypothetical protein